MRWRTLTTGVFGVVRAGAQDGSAVPDDFLIAEVYKEKDNETFVHLFSFLLSL
jgi:hypothetical protein